MSKGCLKRLNREVNDLNKIKSIEYVKLEIEESTENNKNGGPFIEILKDNMIIKFIFSYDYPFKPPKLFINNRRYYDFLKISCKDKLKILNDKFNIKCLCCETFTCSHNWSPALRLTHFIEEIDKFKKIKIYLESKRIGPIMLNLINKYKNYILPIEMIDHICLYF